MCSGQGIQQSRRYVQLSSAKSVFFFKCILSSYKWSPREYSPLFIFPDKSHPYLCLGPPHLYWPVFEVVLFVATGPWGCLLALISVGISSNDVLLLLCKVWKGSLGKSCSKQPELWEQLVYHVWIWLCFLPWHALPLGSNTVNCGSNVSLLGARLFAICCTCLMLHQRITRSQGFLSLFKGCYKLLTLGGEGSEKLSSNSLSCTEMYHTIESFVLPKQLLLLLSSVDTLTGRGCLLLASVFCEHTAWFVMRSSFKK